MICSCLPICCCRPVTCVRSMCNRRRKAIITHTPHRLSPLSLETVQGATARSLAETLEAAEEQARAIRLRPSRISCSLLAASARRPHLRSQRRNLPCRGWVHRSRPCLPGRHLPRLRSQKRQVQRTTCHTASALLSNGFERRPGRNARRRCAARLLQRPLERIDELVVLVRLLQQHVHLS